MFTQPACAGHDARMRFMAVEFELLKHGGGALKQVATVRESVREETRREMNLSRSHSTVCPLPFFLHFVGHYALPSCCLLSTVKFLFFLSTSMLYFPLLYPPHRRCKHLTWIKITISITVSPCNYIQILKLTELKKKHKHILGNWHFQNKEQKLGCLYLVVGGGGVSTSSKF